jgi:hypothetical protein
MKMENGKCAAYFFMSVIKHLTHMLVLSAENYGSSDFGGTVSSAIINKMGSFQKDDVHDIEGRSS